MHRRCVLAGAARCALLIAGCASAPAIQNPSDPLERVNRGFDTSTASSITQR
jgi:hypothetical protein